MRFQPDLITSCCGTLWDRCEAAQRLRLRPSVETPLPYSSNDLPRETTWSSENIMVNRRIVEKVATPAQPLNTPNHVLQLKFAATVDRVDQLHVVLLRKNTRRPTCLGGLHRIGRRQCQSKIPQRQC
jgi:hypothetical protein